MKKRTARKAARRAAVITETCRRRIVDRKGDWDDEGSERRLGLRLLEIAAWRLQFLTLRRPLQGDTWFRKMPGVWEPNAGNMREELGNLRQFRLDANFSPGLMSYFSYPLPAAE